MKGDLRAGAKNVGFTAGTYAAVQLVGALLANNTTGAVAIQAVVAEFAAGRLEIAWSDPLAEVQDGKAIARRAGRGAAFGAATAMSIVGLAFLTGGLSFGDVPGASSSLVLGVIVAALAAVRDELLLRGMVLRAFRDLVPRGVLVLICGLAGAAAAGLETSPLGLVAAGLAAATFASLWLRDRGAWLAWGAHVAYASILGPVMRGGIFDARPKMGLLGGGDAGPEGGLAGVAVLATAAILAFIWSRRASPDAA